jgi:hypothetical protein
MVGVDPVWFGMVVGLLWVLPCVPMELQRSVGPTAWFAARFASIETLAQMEGKDAFLWPGLEGRLPDWNTEAGAPSHVGMPLEAASSVAWTLIHHRHGHARLRCHAWLARWRNQQRSSIWSLIIEIPRWIVIWIITQCAATLYAELFS